MYPSTPEGCRSIARGKREARNPWNSTPKLSSHPEWGARSSMSADQACRAAALHAWLMSWHRSAVLGLRLGN